MTASLAELSRFAPGSGNGPTRVPATPIDCGGVNSGLMTAIPGLGFYRARLCHKSLMPSARPGAIRLFRLAGIGVRD